MIKAAILTAQVSFPGLTDFKASCMAVYRGALKKPLQPEITALKFLSISGTRPLLDVGGALGQSVAGMRFFCKDAPVVSFEPNPFFSSRIKQRFQTDLAVKVETLALSNTDGQFPLYIPIYKYCTFPELGTLDRTEAENWLSSRLYGYNKNYLTIAEFPCKCVRLDSLHLDPEAIKIDTRCSSSMVIEGGAKTVARSKPAILLEATKLSQPCIQFLHGLGYKMFKCRDGLLRRASITDPVDLLLTDAHFRGAPLNEWLESSEQICPVN
ncbi:MAG TPA: FkbM family methyltransferase [Lacunisphaera sp.]